MSPRHKNRNCHESLRDINTEVVTKIVPMRAVNFSIGPFCTEFRCERDDDYLFFGSGSFRPRDTKTEMVTKVLVPVRAVNLLIGPFCTEFRCEQLCADICQDRHQLLGLRHNHRHCHESSPRESCGPLDRTILHRISVQTTF